MTALRSIQPARKFPSPVCPPPKPKRKSPPGSKQKVSARKPSITNCATGCSAASVTGASRSRLFGSAMPAGNLYHEALPESALPVLPPTLEDYKPTADGEPPLARAKDWVNLPDGSTRETNTMPQWAGSCWYYLRYLDAKNPDAFVGKEAEQLLDGHGRARCPQRAAAAGIVGPTPGVDLYVGGTEHAVLHLLYARFWHKVLFDLGYVSTPEPFFKLVNQGMILGEDNQKMSKSRGNVMNPDRRASAGSRHGRVPALRNVHGPARNGEAVEHQGRRGRVSFPRPRLAAVRG